MNGAQFYIPWVSEAGGGLARNKTASSTKKGEEEEARA
jgi:hypothetical protein